MSIDVNPEEDFHVVLNGNVMALPLERLDDWYQSEIINEATLIWQQGFGEWMRLDAVLAQLEQGVPEFAPAPPLSEDTYFVLVAEGEVKQMSLDLMADSFRLDVIDDETLVWQPGYTEWIPLKLLIGEEPPQHVSVAPSFAAPAPYSFAPSAPYSSAPSSPYSSSFGASAPPLAFSIPSGPPKASPWFQRSLAAVAVFAFTLVAYRNGAGLALADGLGQAEQFSALEAEIEAPGPETPHGLDTWLAKVEATYHLAELSETEPLKKSASKDESTESGEVEGALAKADADKAAAPKRAAPAKDAAAVKDAAGPTKEEAAPDKGQLDAFSARLKNEPLPQKQPVRAPVRQKRSSSGGLPSSGNAYDPMNGSL